MTTDQKGYTIDEVARVAREIYDRDIKQVVELEHTGEYLVLDIKSGGYEMDRDEMHAALRARDRFPNGIRHGFRVGYKTTGRIGAKAGKVTAP